MVAAAGRAKVNPYHKVVNMLAQLTAPATVAQTKTYALLLEKPDIDPEVGLVYTEWSTEITITAGYIPEQGGGEIARLTALVAADGWTITALIDTAEPDTEF